MTYHEHEPQPGTVTDRYRRPCDGTARPYPGADATLTGEQAADRYPLRASCGCAALIACADGTADWGELGWSDVYDNHIRTLEARPRLLARYPGARR